MTSRHVSVTWACVVTAAAALAVLCDSAVPGLNLYYGLL